MTAPYILARTFADAHGFAQGELGLGKGHYRVVNSSGTLKAVRGTDLYLVPGWRNRFDRFAMQSAIRWTRMNVIDGEELIRENLAERLTYAGVAGDHEAVKDLLEPAGVQLTLVSAEEATAFVVTLEKTQEQAQEPAPRRRRRRCDECGILVDPDEVDQHAADHLPEDV